jgi:hypothetical protein
VSPATVSNEEPLDKDKILKTLLNDGRFINLTLLAKAILSHNDDVDPSTLSSCWKTLDVLRTAFRINRTDISGHSLKLFDDVHSKTRSRINAEEPGFSVERLLEILDAVDGGRRISKVFQDHPDIKYHCKADLVFGKDHIRNPDLFRAFAHCLPHFVTYHPKTSVSELMEGLVLRDHLWTSLQVHLANSLRPNSSIQTMLHVFERCCIVIDAAFVALENSKVDWRAPDFGSLAHYFELFVTDCFQGIFIERATGFRVGLIKARFCKAVLSQFLDEFKSKGTVIFRSHWDVASLARVFYSLGVGEDTDVEFWKSFVDGGPVDPEFMAKTHKMLHKAEHDAPLLNFCKLGHLGMIAVPFEGSGLEDTDFEKLLDLMQKMMEVSDSRSLLTNASTAVREHLHRLREEVVNIRKKIDDEDLDEAAEIWERSSNENDMKHMNALLLKIEAAHPSSAQEHPSHPWDRAQAQPSGTSALMELKSLSSGLIPGDNKPSHASTSTAFIEDQHDNSSSQDVEPRGMVVPW